MNDASERRRLWPSFLHTADTVSLQQHVDERRSPEDDRADTGLLTDIYRDCLRRLRLLAAVCTCVWLLMLALMMLLFEDNDWSEHASRLTLAAPLVLGTLASATAYLALRSGAIQGRRVADAGLVYLIATAAAIAYANVVSYSLAGQLRGQLWTCMLLLSYPAFIPTSKWRFLIGASVSVVLDPLATFAYIAVAQGAVPSPLGLLNWIECYMAVGVGFVVAHVLHGFKDKVEQARALGSYQLEALIGEGGMGEVWRARHNMLSRPAAIKLIRPDAVDPEHAEAASTTFQRFEREAQATALLGSPHSIEIFDFGLTRAGTFYYVMELLDGIDLSTLVTRYGPVPSARVAYLLAQVCHALDDAHRTGIIHRDIKPSNIFISKQGQDHDFVKVLDFGLVKSLRADATELTLSGTRMAVVGTPAFMPPEQARPTDGLDHRADLYALGCVAYWLLTGALVFEARSALRMVIKHVEEPPTPPSARVDVAIDPALEQIVMQCLQKSPADRPHSARAIRDMLAALAFDEPWDQAQAEAWWRQSHQSGSAP